MTFSGVYILPQAYPKKKKLKKLTFSLEMKAESAKNAEKMGRQFFQQPANQHFRPLKDLKN